MGRTGGWLLNAESTGGEGNPQKGMGGLNISQFDVSRDGPIGAGGSVQLDRFEPLYLIWLVRMASPRRALYAPRWLEGG
jgi:hypothetical protein